MKSRYGYRTPVPSISASKAQTNSISYKGGANSFKDNDDLKPTEVAKAIDARFVKIGRYKTRRGLDRYSVPVGEAINVQQSSTTGAGTQPVGGGRSLGQRLTTTAAGRITRVDVRLKSRATSQGVLLVEVYTSQGGKPGQLLCRSSILPAAITGSAAWLPVYFSEAPLVNINTELIVVTRAQSASVSVYDFITTTSASDAIVSTDGVMWTPASYALNVRLYTSTNGGVKGLIRAYRPNASKVTLFAHGNTVASVNDSTGAITALKTDFVTGTTHYRARMIQDAVYWVNGLEKPWKWDFDTWTQLTAAPYVPSLIEEHKGLLFFNDVADSTRIFYSNFADYGTFTSTDFIYVPAPKTGDPVVAFAKLNGVLFPFTRNNKFQLYGSDNDTFNLDEAASQRGTFTQESVIYDANFIYHADDEGIWRFDGSSEKNLALPFLEDYLAIPDKSTIQLDIYENRLYCFYAPAGAADNTRCFVMNLLLGVYESEDVSTTIGRTFGRRTQDDLFIQASNRVAALYYGELKTNDFHNLGDQIQFEVRTAYDHFGRPGEYKRVPKWRPQFPSQVGYYALQVGYDRDYEETPVFQDVPVTGSGPRYNTGVTFNSGARYSGQRMVAPTSLHIPGNFRRVQRRYKHVAAREPVELDSEVLYFETQRLT